MVNCVSGGKSVKLRADKLLICQGLYRNPIMSPMSLVLINIINTGMGKLALIPNSGFQP